MNVTQPIDWPLIRSLAECSANAYTASSACDRATDAQALVQMVGNDIVVAFRGSSAPEDFLQDAKFRMVPLTYVDNSGAARVHLGFLEDYAALAVHVVSQVRTLLAATPGAKVFVTGHSLGGGIAVLCALIFARQHLPVAGVITFGQPRVGNAAFKALYNDTPVINFNGDEDSPPSAFLDEITFHVVNADDPVPLLPPLLNGYRDEGNEIFLPRPWCANRSPKINPAIGFQLFDDLLGVLDSWRHGKLAFLPNHFIRSYRERIASL
ncbi:MAG TPA: lipase family protein [Verrucomicrobiae bacterium]|nr:lipase family protein [Verrucomicrobiae bacterium]